MHPLARIATPLFLAAFSTVANAAASPDVLVVDPAGTGDFTTITDAVQAAQDGDVVYVRPGSYAAFTIDAKSIDVVAAQTGNVRVIGGSEIRSVSVGGSVVVSGLRFESGVTPSPATLQIVGCAGSVRLADCTIEGLDGELFAGPSVSHPACRVLSSDRVALIGCNLRGGDAGADFFCSSDTAAAGLVAFSSVVEVHGGAVRGGSGPIGDLGGHAGAAVELRSASELRAYGASLRGGDGGEGDLTFTFCSCGNGGDGVFADATSSAIVRGGATSGGTGGGQNLNGAPGTCPSGAASVGAVNLQTAPVRSFEVARVVETGAQISGSIRGVAGEAVFLVVSTVPALQPYPALGGTLTVGWPYFLRALPVGQIPASGVLGFTENVAGFAPGFGALTLTMQPIMSGTGGRWLGVPDVVVVVEPGL